MANSTDLIRNVAIAGHGSTGKTSLLEHILFQGGAIGKPETIESKKTVSDYGEEEIARKISVRATLTHVQAGDVKINFIDTPGSSDFIGDVILAFRSWELLHKQRRHRASSAGSTLSANEGAKIVRRHE